MNISKETGYKFEKFRTQLLFTTGDCTIPFMVNKRILWAGVAAGVLCHILQGSGAYLLFDRFYFENPDIVRDPGLIVGVYYLIINVVLGIVMAHLAYYFHAVWETASWNIGLRAGIVLWAGSSPIWIAKRQILLKLSNWLLLEIIADAIIYSLVGILAGYLVGIIVRREAKEK